MAAPREYKPPKVAEHSKEYTNLMDTAKSLLDRTSYRAPKTPKQPNIPALRNLANEMARDDRIKKTRSFDTAPVETQTAAAPMGIALARLPIEQTFDTGGTGTVSTPTTPKEPTILMAQPAPALPVRSPQISPKFTETADVGVNAITPPAVTPETPAVPMAPPVSTPPAPSASDTAAKALRKLRDKYLQTMDEGMPYVTPKPTLTSTKTSMPLDGAALPKEKYAETTDAGPDYGPALSKGKKLRAQQSETHDAGPDYAAALPEVASRLKRYMQTQDAGPDNIPAQEMPEISKRLEKYMQTQDEGMRYAKEQPEAVRKRKEKAETEARILGDVLTSMWLKKDERGRYKGFTYTNAEEANAAAARYKAEYDRLIKQEYKAYDTLDDDKKLDYLERLVALNRPLTESEREISELCMKALLKQYGRIIDSDIPSSALTEEQREARILYNALYNKTRAGAGVMAGVLSSLGVDRLYDMLGIEEAGDMIRNTAGRDHPQAGAIGKLAGGAGKMYLAGQAAGALGGAAAKAIPGLSGLPPLLSGAAQSGTALGLTGLYDGALGAPTKKEWDAAEQEKARLYAGYTPREYDPWMPAIAALKEGGIRFAGGMAGGLAGGVVGELGAEVLTKYGMQTPFAEAVRQTVAGTAFAAGDIGATYYLRPEEHRPSGEQIAQGIGMAFLYSALSAAIGTPKATGRAETELGARLDAAEQVYTEYISRLKKGMSTAEQKAALTHVQEMNDAVREMVTGAYYPGQQGRINDVLLTLDALDEQMGLLWRGTGALSAGPVMLPPPAGAKQGFTLKLLTGHGSELVSLMTEKSGEMLAAKRVIFFSTPPNGTDAGTLAGIRRNGPALYAAYQTMGLKTEVANAVKELTGAAPEVSGRGSVVVRVAQPGATALLGGGGKNSNSQGLAVLRNAEYVGSELDYGGDPSRYIWHYFCSPVDIGNGKTVDVQIALREERTSGTQIDGGKAEEYNENGNRSEDAGSKLPQTTTESVKTKLDTYLLEPTHLDGGSKAKWFEQALGFDKRNADILAEQIKSDSQLATQTAVTEYGTKFSQIIPIEGTNGRVIDVEFIWIRNNDGVIRLVTSIPPKR